MIIDFAIQTKGESLLAGMDSWQAKADSACAVDYSFHAIVSDVTEASLKEMDELVAQGVTSFKLFMAYPGVFYSTDKDILRAMDRATGNGASHHDARRERHRHRRNSRGRYRPRTDRSHLPRADAACRNGGRGRVPSHTLG